MEVRVPPFDSCILLHMKLLFFYGPPGVGKLTVARALARRTGYKIFHNHLTIDLIQSLFDWGTEPFDKFLTKYRLELMEATAREGIKGLIFTYVYGDTVSDKTFIASVIRVVHKHNGTVLFVRLTCPERVLIQRIKHVSRRKTNKIQSVKMLKSVLRQYDLFQSVPKQRSLTIDTSMTNPGEAATIIQDHCALS